MINVFHVITSLNVGGAETALYRLVSNSNSSNFKHSIVALKGESYFTHKFREIGVEVVHLNIRGPLSFLFAIYRLFSLFKLRSPDIVQTWLYHADFFAGCIAKLCGVKRIIWSVRTTRLKNNFSITAIIRYVCVFLSYFVPDKVVYVANSSRIYHENLGYNRKKTVVIFNGYDFEMATPLCRIEFNSSYPVVGMVGRFSFDKGYDVFLRSASILLDQGLFIKFVMVGSGFTSSNEKLVSLISSLNLTSYITLAGHADNVFDVLSTFDYFVLPSRTEAFPNVLVEAIASGLPVVASDVGDVRNILSDDNFIFNPADPCALADSLLRLIKLNAFERNAYALNNLNFVRTNFDISFMVGSYESLYFSMRSL